MCARAAVTHKHAAITKAKSTMSISFTSTVQTWLWMSENTGGEINTHTHTLKSSTLIHCIRCQYNSPAAISQRGHSWPSSSPLCQCKLTCHHLTILIKPQVQSGSSPTPNTASAGPITKPFFSPPPQAFLSITVSSVTWPSLSVLSSAWVNTGLKSCRGLL